MRTWYQGDWLNLQRGSNDDEKITLILVQLHLMVKLLRQILTEEHDVRLHDCLVGRQIAPTTFRNYLHTEAPNAVYG